MEFYYAEAGESEAANFDAMRTKIIENPDRYILETTVLSEDDNAGSKQYTVAVKVSLNVANLRNDIKAGSAVGKATRAERSALAFLFAPAGPSAPSESAAEHHRCEADQADEGEEAGLHRPRARAVHHHHGADDPDQQRRRSDHHQNIAGVTLRKRQRRRYLHPGRWHLRRCGAGGPNEWLGRHR